MKKINLLIFLCCILSSHAQDISFEQTVHFIQKKVSCCSVPFAASTKSKVDSVAIFKNGNTTLFYPDKKPKQTFNIFKLYKEDNSATGIDTILGGKFIQFYVSKERIRLIRFATPQDAKEVYTALLQLLTFNKTENKPVKDLDFEETKDVINGMLAKWAERGNIYKITAEPNGSVAIINGRDQSFQFNLFDLSSNQNNNKSDDYRIETITCDVKTQAPLAWINFNTKNGQVAFIRLKCETSKAALDSIRNAFLHLKSLCSNSNTLHNTSSAAIYFVSRNTVLQSGNKMLAGSIRSIDKKDEGDTTLSVYSNGEGWLDKDSFPIGDWNFYSKNKAGKEYLFKSGTYHRTTAPMFEVTNIDSTDLAKKYGTSYYSLQQAQLQIIPFIKTNQWHYYHANGKIWKKVNYKISQVPIITNIVMNDPANQASTELIIVLKEELDEWIAGELKEYDEKGSVYKKLQYHTTGEVYKKILYNKNGIIIKTETAKPHQNPVLPTKY